MNIYVVLSLSLYVVCRGIAMFYVVFHYVFCVLSMCLDVLLMNFYELILDSKMSDEDICLVDSASTHTIFQDKRYFLSLTLAEANMNTISGRSNLIEGS